MPVPDDRLAGLAERTRRHWREHARARRASIAAFIKMGALLAEADGEVERGGWLAYLARAGIPRRTAQRAIRLFRSGLSADEVAARCWGARGGDVREAPQPATSTRLPMPRRTRRAANAPAADGEGVRRHARPHIVAANAPALGESHSSLGRLTGPRRPSTRLHPLRAGRATRSRRCRGHRGRHPRPVEATRDGDRLSGRATAVHTRHRDPALP